MGIDVLEAAARVERVVAGCDRCSPERSGPPVPSSERCDCMNPFLMRPMRSADGVLFCGYCKGRLSVG